MDRKTTATDWDSRKMHQLAKEYMDMRKEIWQPLAQRTGEKWNVVEQKVRFATKNTPYFPIHQRLCFHCQCQ